MYSNCDTDMLRDLLDQQNVMHLEGWRSRERAVWLKPTEIHGVTLQRMQSTACLLQKRERQPPLARSLANPIQFFPKIAFLVQIPEQCLPLLET